MKLHAKVIDSCIDIIVSRPVIREHHPIQKIPHYFDETTSSRLVTPIGDASDTIANEIEWRLRAALHRMHLIYVARI
jgi:hypothetical protein